jgi:hypothetical protein
MKHEYWLEHVDAPEGTVVAPPARTPSEGSWIAPGLPYPFRIEPCDLGAELVEELWGVEARKQYEEGLRNAKK